MFIGKNDLHRYILISVAIITGALAIASLIISPAISADPAEGFQVLRSMRLGSDFNYMVSPSQDDISKNAIQFFTWWSPGQYSLPYGIQILTGFDLGKSIAITVTLAEAIGLTGFYFFFKKLGFSKLIASTSLLLIVCQKAFMNPHFYYDGGEVLLFSFEGWFLYGCLMSPVTRYRLVLFIILSCFWGFFLKSSFLWIYGVGIFCLFIRCCWLEKGFRNNAKNMLYVSAPASLALTAIYVCFISRGVSPAQVFYGFKVTPEAFSYPLSSPLLSGFSIDEMLGGILVPTGYKLLISFYLARLILFFCALGSIALIYFILRFVTIRNYRLMVLSIFLSALAFFVYAYLRQYEISMESRHFRIVGILITPGVIFLTTRIKPKFRATVFILLTCVACYSFFYVINGYKTNQYLSKGPLGISQPNIDQISLNQIISFDNVHRNIIFVFIGNDIGLEIQHNRIITLPPIAEDLKIDTDQYKYCGHGGALYIVLPRFYAGKREEFILNAFPAYKRFKHYNLSNYYELFIAN